MQNKSSGSQTQQNVEVCLRAPFQKTMSLFLAGIGLNILSKLQKRLDPDGLGFKALCDRQSSVHTQAGDLVLPERRSSFGHVGDEKGVFEVLQTTVPAGFEVVEGHYDLIHYEIGGHFARHKDFVPVTAPGLKWWHALLCLEAPDEGGQTRVFSEKGFEDVSWATGDVLLVAGAEHEGLAVIAGCKTLLKFDVWQFEHGKELRRYRCADGAARMPADILQHSSFFEKLFNFEEGYKEHSMLGLSLADLAMVYAYLGGGTDAADPMRLHELLELLCCPEATLAPLSFRALQMPSGAVAVESHEAAVALAAMARQEFYELFVVLRRAEWITAEGSTYCHDRGIFLLSAKGKPLFSTRGDWLGPAASRAFQHDYGVQKHHYSLEPPLPQLKGNAGFNLDDDPEMSPRWSVFMNPDEAEPVIAVAANALRAVLHAQEARRSTEVPGEDVPHPNPEWCQKMEAIVSQTCKSFDDFDCNGGSHTERSVYEYCNDGDGYYSSEYVSTVFAVDWLLCRRN